jgi:amino acid permease
MEQLNAYSVLQSRSVCIALAFVLIAPISFMPSLDALKFTSWLSGAMLLYMVLLIFLYALHIPDNTLFDPCYQFNSSATQQQCSGSQSLVVWDMETVKILSVFIFNFSCQQNVFTIVNELKDPTPLRVNSVFAATMGTATVLYVIVTYSAYSTFGSAMLTDVVKMYPSKPTHCLLFLFDN